MSILNRRNAMLGWAAWAVGKRVLKRKAKAAVPSRVAEARGPSKRGVALLVATGAGVAAFIRRRSGSDDDA